LWLISYQAASDFIRLPSVACHVRHCSEFLWAFRKAVRLGPPIQNAERKKKEIPPKGNVFLSRTNLKLRKRDIMEVVKDIRDLAFVALFIVTALAPRIISAYHAARKAA
jgi:hypothetical protein